MAITPLHQRQSVGSAPPLVRGGRHSSHFLRTQGLIAKILVASIIGYPLLGTLVAYTDFPSLLASIPVRLYVLFCSALLISRSRHQSQRLPVRILYAFWAAYAVRLLVDLLGSRMPDTDIDIVFFVATCVIPTLAIIRPGVLWDEASIARWLTVTGTATCAFALLPLVSGMGADRSLLEETGRLSFDTVNPITYGHVAVTTTIGGLVSLRHTARAALQLAWIGCIVIASVALQMAASRGPVVVLGACLISLAICSRGRKRVVLLTLCLVAVFAAVSFNSDSSIWQRFSIVEDDPSTIERILLQTNAIQQFLDNPLLGSAHLELESLTYPHNPLLEAGMAIGVVGLVLFAILCVWMLFRIFAQLRRGDILIPLLGLQYFLGAQFSGALFQSSGMWILMAMVFVSGKRISHVPALHPCIQAVTPPLMLDVQFTPASAGHSDFLERSNMRIFQNSGLYPAYLPRLARLTSDCATFAASRDAFLADRFGACHYLLPVLEGHPDAFFTNGDELRLQQLWAQEHGMPANATLASILLAQIEHHRAEVFYNLDPMRYGSDFVRKLPGCVKKAIAWRAAPSPGGGFGAYDAVVCNFPSIIESYRERGWRAEYFSPAHDPEMDTYATNTDRPIDVLFVGGYSRHHRQRAVILEAVSSLREHLNVVFCLDRSRLTRLAESPIGHFLPFASHRRPPDIRAVSHEPVFGRELYSMISRAKIVLNGAVDMAGTDRGNMRCFEAMGCGSLMVSDQGRYPEVMQNGKTMLLYEGAGEAKEVIQGVLENSNVLRAIALQGQRMISECYSKSNQWADFIALVGRL